MKKRRLLSLALMASIATLNANETTTKLNDITVISASGFEQNISDAPASISVITAEELQKKSYTDVLDAVKNVPGVYVTGGGAFQEISFRGMEGKYTMYLIDGKPISSARQINPRNDYSLGKSEVNLPPIDMIERIEIIRGPMSSLYGSEAMGGVINVITKKHSDKWSGSLSSEYTKPDNDISSTSHTTSMFLSGPLLENKLSLDLNGLYSASEESDYYEDGSFRSGTSSQPKERKRKLGTKLSWSFDDQNEIDFSYDYNKQEYTTTPGVSIGATGRDANTPYIGIRKEIYAIAHSGNYENFNIDSYYQIDAAEKINIDSKDNKETVKILNSQASYALKNQMLIFGAQYKVEELYLPEQQVDGNSANSNRWLGSIFLEDDWSLSDDFNLTVGLRYNDDEFFGGHLSPRIYGVYHAADSLTLKGGVSTGYKQPTLGEATDGYGEPHGGGTTMFIGNSNLKPEESTSYEISANYLDDENNFASSITLFHTKYKNKIDYDELCSSTGACPYSGSMYNTIRQYTNIKEAELEGVELTVDYNVLDNLKVSGSYTYTQSEQKSGDYIGMALTKMPKNMFNVSFDWQTTTKLTTWGQYNYRGSAPDYAEDTEGTPGYGFFDAGIAYKALKNMNLTLGLYNVMDKEVNTSTNSSVLDGRVVTVGMNVKF